jgi:hypothetical protein
LNTLGSGTLAESDATLPAATRAAVEVLALPLNLEAYLDAYIEAAGIRDGGNVGDAARL